jgi:hypothetical protein
MHLPMPQNGLRLNFLRERQDFLTPRASRLKAVTEFLLRAWQRAALFL